jgi:hypothetical protein
MQRTAFGGTVVACGGHRLALDKRIASRVLTRPVTVQAA